MVDEEEGLESRIQACQLDVARDPAHFLSFKGRRHLLLWFGEPLSPEAVFATAMTRGHRIRARLALSVAERAMPIWSAHHGGKPGDAAGLVDASRSVVVGGQGDREALFDEGMLLKNHLDGGAPPSTTGFGYVYAGYAMAFAALAIAQDELLVPGYGATLLDVEDPQEHHTYDCAAWGAAAEAGDFPWGNRKFYSSDRSRAYWQWYLEEAVPGAIRTSADDL